MTNKYKGYEIDLPLNVKKRFRHKYNLEDSLTNIILNNYWVFSRRFETVADLYGDGQKVAKWFCNDIVPYYKERNLSKELFCLIIPANDLLEIRKMLDDENITKESSFIIFDKLMEHRLEIIIKGIKTQ